MLRKSNPCRPYSSLGLVATISVLIAGLSPIGCVQPASNGSSTPASDNAAGQHDPASSPRVSGGAPPSSATRTPPEPVNTLRQDYANIPIPLRIILDPVTATEAAQLGAENKGQPLQVGFGRAIPAPHQSELLSRLQWTSSPHGGIVSAFTVTSPQAGALRVALAASSLAGGVEIRFFSPSSPTQAFGPFTSKHLLPKPGAGRSSTGQEPFWSPVIQGETVGVEIYLPSADALSSSSLRLLQVSHLS